MKIPSAIIRDNAKKFLFESARLSSLSLTTNFKKAKQKGKEKEMKENKLL